jgi:hypothetical protein
MQKKLSALAILAAGCGGESPMLEAPMTPDVVAAQTPPVPADPPSVAVYDWGEVPAPEALTIPSSQEVAARWMLPARNPWAPYQKATLLAALDTTERSGLMPAVERLDEVVRARQAAAQVAAAGLPDATMWVVDLRGAASVAFAATLSAGSSVPVSAVMTFHNWPADNETVPAEETLAALATMRPVLPPASNPGAPVFMLDAWRLTHRYDRPDDESTDNRYMLTESDLPSTVVLENRGIRRVIYVVDSVDASQAEEDDLHAVFASYQKSGIDVGIVDLADLLSMASQRPLVPYYGHPLLIDPFRVTLIDDPSFYFRARGGFGGVHVINSGGYAFGGCYGRVFGFHGGG